MILRYLTVISLVVVITITPCSGADNLASAAPPDTVCLLSINNAGELGNALERSPVGQVAEESPVIQSGLQLIRSGLDFFAQYSTSSSWAEVSDLLPQQWGIVILDIPPNASRTTKPGVACFGILPDNATKLQHLIGKRLLPNLNALAEDTTYSTQIHQGLTLHKFKKPGEPATFLTITKRLLIIGNDAGIKAFSATVTGKREPFGATKYDAIPGMASRGATLMETVIDFAPSLKRKLTKLSPTSKEIKDMRFLGTDALHTLTCDATSIGELFLEVMTFDMMGKADQGLLGALNHADQIELKSEHIAPGWASLHIALSITSGVDLLAEIRDLVGASQGEAASTKLDEALTFLGTQFNIDVNRDLLARLGPEIFVAAAPLDLKTWAGKRKPRWTDVSIVGGFQVKEPDVVLFIIQRILQSALLTTQGWTVSSETHKKTRINIARSPDQTFELAYTVVDDFLIISWGLKPIKQILDSRAGKKNIPTTISNPLPRKTVALIHVFPGPILEAFSPSLLAKVVPPLQPFVPAMKEALGELREVRAVIVSSRHGPRLVSIAPLPALTTITALAGLDHFGKAPLEQRVDLARERMKEIGKGLRKYHRINKRPPTSLMDLTKPYLDSIPTDPFNKGATFGYKSSALLDAWILTSAGPNGKTDINLTSLTASDWRAMQEATDASSIGRAKRLIYQFKPKRFKDEQALDDEGDITLTGQW